MSEQKPVLRQSVLSLSKKLDPDFRAKKINYIDVFYVTC